MRKLAKRSVLSVIGALRNKTEKCFSVLKILTSKLIVYAFFIWKLLFMLIPSNSHRGRKTRDSIYSGLVNFVYAKSQRNSGAADIKMQVKHVIPACIIIFKLKSDENNACVSQHSKYLYLHLILRLSEFFSPACDKMKTHLFITFTFCVLCKLVNQHSRFLLKERRKKIDFINTKHSCDWLNTISSER